MRNYRALLIGNAPSVPSATLKRLAAQADVVLAVDGGADKALRAGLSPNYVIGDLDSVSPRAQKMLTDRLIRVPTQENTDLEKALSWAVKQQVTHATLVGFVGNRWDFSIGNLLALGRWARKLSLCVVGDGWRIFPLVKSAQIVCQKNQRISLLILKPCTGVTLSGCKYLLHDENLLPGTTRTLSNQTTATRIRLSFTRGTLLVYLEGN